MQCNVYIHAIRGDHTLSPFQINRNLCYLKANEKFDVLLAGNIKIANDENLGADSICYLPSPL